ncbi:MAG: hypothetical protein OEZ34_14740, partial [Spirochaetia bacterium]|nr:hypothetical protein [Spirochaetia bacterium]
MNKIIITALYTFLVLFFIFVTNAISDIYMFQLRMQIDREQVHNYELSSRMLKNRFQNLIQQQENFMDEINMSVLESGIMNHTVDPNYFNPTISEYTGFFVANAVRIAVVRPFLKINEDRETLLLLQYAFYMERQKRFKVASEKYLKLEEMLSSQSNDPDRAFVLLHNAYCMALTGDSKNSLERLDRVIVEFPGTHYQETAVLLKSILEGFLEKRLKIEKSEVAEDQKIKLFYKEGLYRSVIEKTQNVNKNDFENLYYRARSLEETGQIPGAIEIYVNIVNDEGDGEFAKKSNRRLVL